MPSGEFIISALTFPEYFNKEIITYTPDTSMEIIIFASVIAPALGVSVRFFGEEPNCRLTKTHHQQLKEILPCCEIEAIEIPRLRHGSTAISASIVRNLLSEEKFEEVGKLVPLTTLRYLVSNCRKYNFYSQADTLQAHASAR